MHKIASGEAQDGIERYARCPVQLHFTQDVLHIPAEHTGNIQSFLLLDANLDAGRVADNDVTKSLRLLRRPERTEASSLPSHDSEHQ